MYHEAKEPQTLRPLIALASFQGPVPPIIRWYYYPKPGSPIKVSSRFKIVSGKWPWGEEFSTIQLIQFYNLLFLSFQGWCCVIGTLFLDTLYDFGQRWSRERKSEWKPRSVRFTSKIFEPKPCSMFSCSWEFYQQNSLTVRSMSYSISFAHVSFLVVLESQHLT